MFRPNLDLFHSGPRIDNQLRYLLTGTGCSLLPLMVTLLLPDPWQSALLPLALLFGSYGALFGLALFLYALAWLWRLVRPAPTELRCPVCFTTDRPYRPFFVDRLAPTLVRVHCPECHERWLERG
jgi:hypothetical protein